MLKLVFVALIAANGVFMATAKSKARCKKGEIWEPCPESQCNPLTCKEVGFHINCPSSSDECNCWGDPQCICKDGKVRDDKGNCINPEDCPECGGDPNAVVDPCASLCAEGVPCAAVCVPNTCKCRKGYVYDQYKNICVPIGDCSHVCGPNEVYSSCANGGCGKWNCTQIGEPDLCIDPLHCEGGCICKKGYLRAKDGTCVPEEQCYYDVCPKNEIYDLCPASCPRRTCGLNDRGIFCIRPLPVGDPNCPPPKCRCQDGFYRDHKGNCVTLDQCPLCSKPNEIYHPCPPPCPFRRCDIDDSLVLCAPLADPACQPGCICAVGYVRNDKGYCVTRAECPKCTGAHEVYDKCPSTCPPQTCESIGKVYFCPAELPCKQCEGQCVCEPDYYRNKKGECIAKEDCLKCTGAHEFFSCWVACDNVCATLSVQNQTHCPIINVDCNRMCYCEEGYARDANNICVPINQCPQNQCTKPNEEYQQCPNCNPGTCDSIGKIYHCPLRPCKLTDPGECRCKAGFYRNKAGDCVTKEQCAKEQCNKPNEEYQQCVEDCSPGTCESIGKSYSCPAHPNCDGQCRCKPGYFWNKLGECVTKEQCEQCNKPNEEYQQCVEDCSPGTCESIGKSYNCPAHPNCDGQCRCKPGYFWNKLGDCITKEQCLMCNGTHEYFSCGPACDNVCATLDKQNKTNCPIINKRCNEMCYCEDGYARDEHNVCVPIDQCKVQCSKPNEIYHPCPPKCPPRRCDVDDRLIRCAAPPKLGDPECEPGCICADGFVRNDSGYCVTRDECPKCTGAHEVYDKCPRTCPPQTCESIGNVYSCPAEPPARKHCEGQCMCEPGYYRNEKGECITKEECLKCTGPHEYFSCWVACDNVCATLSVQNQTHCPIINVDCNRMCYCEEGYARDANNICVQIDQCPQNQCTKPNEEYQQWPDCNPGTCDSIGKKYHCPSRPCKLTDPGECRCKAGFYRNKAGDCVTKEQCAKEQCNKPNEEYQQCVEDCSPGTCESIGKSYNCPAHPNCDGQCRCKPGYFWNKLGDCITKEQCLKCSGPNEFYSCGGACDNVCSNLSTQNQTHCPIVNIKCNEKCYCDDGYARDDCNICIPIDQCPPETTTSTTTTTTAKPTTGSPPGTCPSDGLALLLTGNAAFTAKFLYELVKGNPKASIITSPASVLIPIGELAMCANGVTYDELIKVLNLRNKDEIRCVFPQLISKLSTQKDVILNLAAKIFANADFPLSDNFLDDTKTIFDAEAENLNFTDKVAAANKINQWVEDQTNNRIQDIATPDMFSALTRLVLANAIYFLGNWENQFNPNKTEVRDFHRADNSIIQLPTMFQEKTFRYADVSSLDCKVLELPYKGNFSFLIFLPNKNDGVLEVLQKLLDITVFYNAYDSMNYETVDVYLPKMNVTMEFDLADIMKKTGIKEIFNQNGAGLSGILKKDEPLFVSTAMQKAYIEVNEIGTEAAAANVIVITRTTASLPKTKYLFKADHPFIFYILNEKDPIFCGIFGAY